MHVLLRAEDVAVLASCIVLRTNMQVHTAMLVPAAFPPFLARSLANLFIPLFLPACSCSPLAHTQSSLTIFAFVFVRAGTGKMVDIKAVQDQVKKADEEKAKTKSGFQRGYGGEHGHETSGTFVCVGVRIRVRVCICVSVRVCVSVCVSQTWIIALYQSQL